MEREKALSRGYVFPASGNVPLQVVRWTEQRTSIVLGGASVRVTLPAGSEVIELTATENCFINFGDNTVDATAVIATDGSRLFLAGVQVVPVPIDPATDEPYTHVAAIQDATAGILQIEQVT